MAGHADIPETCVVHRLGLKPFDAGVGNVLVLIELAERAERRHGHRRRRHKIDVALDVVAKHVELAAEGVVGGEDAVIFQIDAGLLILTDLRTKVRIGQEAEKAGGAVGAHEEGRTAPGRVRAGDQGFGDRGRPVAFGIADIGREARYRGQADRDLRREAVAAGRHSGGVQIVAVVADRADDLEPG
ncbi:hypothetical protein ES703_69422 [subsurface metagenome]